MTLEKESINTLLDNFNLKPAQLLLKQRCPFRIFIINKINLDHFNRFLCDILYM